MAVGGGQQKVVPDEITESGFAVRNVIEVTPSADHPVVDSANEPTWLKAFKGYIESPFKRLL